MEKWKEIAGTDGRYEISTQGRIKSNITGRILKTYVNSAGYILATFPVDGVKKRRQVHRLVADAFIPNPDGKPFINHIDANRTNNHIENLEWCTGSENARHSFKLGISKRFPHHEKAVMRSDGVEFPSMSAAARALGVPYSYIRDVCNGRQKRTQGYGFSVIGGDLQ